MKVLIVGASGAIGKAVAAELGARHEIIKAGRSGAEQVDMADAASVAALFDRIGTVDAIVATAGKVHFGPLAALEAYRLWYWYGPRKNATLAP